MHRTDVSVIVPAWNAAATIGHCLRAMAAQDATLDGRAEVEVIVVDDGSLDGTAAVARANASTVHVTVVEQEHGGRAGAVNGGLARAAGQLVVLLDADMIPTRSMLSALLDCYDENPDALLQGFREETASRPIESLLDTDGTAHECDAHPGLFSTDNRFAFRWPGWPKNVTLASAGFTNLAGGRAIWRPDNDSWTAPRTAYGCLTAVSAERIHAVGGCDDSFVGFGWEDTLLAARLEGEGAEIVAVPRASALHVTHHHRSARKWVEFHRNRRRYEELAQAIPAPRSRPVTRPVPLVASDPTRDCRCGPPRRLRHARLSGNAAHAAAVLAATYRPERDETCETTVEALAVLRAAGSDPELLEQRVAHVADRTGPMLLEIGRAFGQRGDFEKARSLYEASLGDEGSRGLARFVLRNHPGRHLARAEEYASDGLDWLAAEYAVAAGISGDAGVRAIASEQIERVATAGAWGLSD